MYVLKTDHRNCAKDQSPFGQGVDNATHWINCYPVNTIVGLAKVIEWVSISPADSIRYHLNKWSQQCGVEAYMWRLLPILDSIFHENNEYVYFHQYCLSLQRTFSIPYEAVDRLKLGTST